MLCTAREQAGIVILGLRLRQAQLSQLQCLGSAAWASGFRNCTQHLKWTALCALNFLCALCLAQNIWLDHCCLFSNFFFQMLFFNVPLMAYLCWCLFLRCEGHSFCSHIHYVRRPLVVLIHLAMTLLLAWQVYSCYFLQRTYGTLAFVFSPMRTWLVALTSFLIYKTWTFQSSELRTYIVEMKNCQSFWNTIQ